VRPGIFEVLMPDLQVAGAAGWLYGRLHLRKSSPLSRLQTDKVLAGVVRRRLSCSRRRLEEPRQLLGQLRAVPHLDTALLEEALVDLQGVPGWLCGDVGTVGQGFHVLDVHDAPLRVHKGYG
jgi:hypothetical protein